MLYTNYNGTLYDTSFIKQADGTFWLRLWHNGFMFINESIVIEDMEEYEDLNSIISNILYKKENYVISAGVVKGYDKKC